MYIFLRKKETNIDAFQSRRRLGEPPFLSALCIRTLSSNNLKVAFHFFCEYLLRNLSRTSEYLVTLISASQSSSRKKKGATSLHLKQNQHSRPDLYHLLPLCRAISRSHHVRYLMPLIQRWSWDILPFSLPTYLHTYLRERIYSQHHFFFPFVGSAMPPTALCTAATGFLEAEAMSAESFV